MSTLMKWARISGVSSVLVLAPSGCDVDDDSPTPLAESPEPDPAVEQQGESGDEGAVSAPAPEVEVDSEKREKADDEFESERVSATLQMNRPRVRGSEDYGVRISPTEDVELPLHAKPDQSSEVVDYAEVQSHHNIGGRHLLVAETTLDTIPAPDGLEADEIVADESRLRGDTTTIDAGEPIGVVEFFEGACGGYTQYVWHDDQTHVVMSGARRDLRDDDEEHGIGAPTFDESHWWMKVSGDDESGGWLLVDADELQVERVDHREIDVDNYYRHD